MSKQETAKEITLLNSLQVGTLFLVIMWGVFLTEIILNVSFSNYGILPRVTSGLWGIIFSPFLHGSWEHIINNSPPIFILTGALFYFYRKIAWEILLLSWIIGGFCIWAAARNGDHFNIYHIGMSGVIYSLAFFVFFSGVFRKEAKLLAIALFVVFLYGSMVWGLLPLQEGVSFEAHLFGAIVGVGLAYIYRKDGATFQKKKYQFEIDEENEEKLRAITDSALDAIIMLDNNGKFIFGNPKAKAILGYEEEELLGKDFHKIVAPKAFHEASKKGYEKFARTGEGDALGKILELSAIKKGGEEFPVSLLLNGVQIDGKWHGIGFMRDITDTKKMQNELKQKDEIMLAQSRQAAMGDMISMIAHQWRQPLNTLGLVLQKLELFHKNGKLDEKKLK